MADVTITYQGRTISEISESTTRALKTKGRFCTDDIVVAYQKDGGGLGLANTYIWEEPPLIFANEYTEQTHQTMWDGTTGTTGEFINASGVVSTNANSITSPFLPVQNRSAYVWSGVASSLGSSNHRVHAFDVNGNWLFQIAAFSPSVSSRYYSRFQVNDTRVTKIKLCSFVDSNVQVYKNPYEVVE